MGVQRKENKGVELTGGGGKFWRMQNEGLKESKAAPSYGGRALKSRDAAPRSVLAVEDCSTRPFPSLGIRSEFHLVGFA
jgi:hypothetical protein